MKLLRFAPFVLIAALGGCGSLDWDSLTSYAGLGSDKPAAPPPAEQAQPTDTSAQAEQYQPWTPVGASDNTPVQSATIAPPAQPATPPAQTYTPPPVAAQTYTPPAPQAAPAPMEARAPIAAPAAAEAPAPMEASAPAPQSVAAAPQAVPPPVVYQPAAPADATPATGGADSWCQAVAQSASNDAASQGFDAATQRHRAVTAYNQCTQYAH